MIPLYLFVSALSEGGEKRIRPSFSKTRADYESKSIQVLQILFPEGSSLSENGDCVQPPKGDAIFPHRLFSQYWNLETPYPIQAVFTETLKTESSF